MKQPKMLIKELSRPCGCALPLAVLVMFGAPAAVVDRVVNMSGENPTIADNLTFENRVGEKGTSWLYGVAVQNGSDQTMAIGNNVVFQNNMGEHFAGGAVANQGNMTIGDNVRFIKNSTIAVDDTKIYANGGALHNERYSGADAVLHISDNALFQENFASRNGGAIFNNEAGEITIGTNARFIGNSVKQGGEGNLSGGYGGAIANNKAGGKITIEDGAVFTENKSNWLGGAIYNGGQMDFWGDATFSGNMSGGILNDIDNAGTLTFNGGNIVLDGGITGNGDITFKNTALAMNIRSTADYTTIAADTITLVGDNTLKFILGASDMTGTTGALFTANITGGSFTVDNSNTLYDIAMDGDYKLTITKKPIVDIVENIGATGNQVAVLNGMLFGGTGNKAFNDAADSIAAMLQNADADIRVQGLKLVSAMAPTDTPQVQSVSQSNTTQVLGAVETRLSGGAAMGRASGDFTIGRSAVWAQGLANRSELDGAFKSDSFGIAAGIEHNFATATKLGLGYAFTKTTVNPSIGESKIDSNTVMAYGEYKPTSWFLNGALSYTFGSYDDNMVIRTAKYNSTTLAAQLITGYEFNATKKIAIVPQIGARYVSTDMEKYADSLGGVINSATYDFLTGIVGAKVAYNITIENNVLRPEIYLGMTYDFQSDKTAASIIMGNGSVVNVAGESLEKTGYEIGAGLNFVASDAIDIGLRYVGRFRKEYTDNTGMIDLKYKF